MADAKEMKFDRRIYERNLRSGVLTREEWDNHLSSLPDRADNAEVIEFNVGRGAEAEPEAPEPPNE